MAEMGPAPVHLRAILGLPMCLAHCRCFGQVSVFEVGMRAPKPETLKPSLETTCLPEQQQEAVAMLLRPRLNLLREGYVQGGFIMWHLRPEATALIRRIEYVCLYI